VTFALALSLSLALGAGELTEAQVGAITLKVPGTWQRREVEGTTRFASPSGEAYIDMDVGQVQRKGGMPAAECLKKILAGMGSPGFKKTKAGGQPAAASKEIVDTDDQGKKFVGLTYVGCDGKTTWSMQFHVVDAKRAEFIPVADQVLKSLTYRKAEK